MSYYMNETPTTDIFRGDIFYITQGVAVGSEQKAGRPGIIVSNDLANKHSPNVEVVFLTSQEKKPLPTHVSILAKIPSTALCENIQTVSKERLSDFIRSCTTKEMKAIDTALLTSLGIEAPAVVGGGIQETTPIAPKDLSGVEVERDLYRSLYERLLDKVISK